MWFLLSIAALFCWSGSDLFSKIGCRDSSDKISHLKMVGAVGIVMGLHALFNIVFKHYVVTPEIMLRYLPVSALYIISMAIGYISLRYIELSVSSPICNCSGVVFAVLYVCTHKFSNTDFFAILAIALIGAGIISLGVVEANEDEELRRLRQDKANFRYSKSWLAIALPVIYCIIDALGTYADNIVLEQLDENSANTAYELTFLIVGVISLLYVTLVKKEKLLPRAEVPKYIGATCETAGQLAYIYAIAGDTAVYAAPIISSYCVLSVIWSAVFLKERLSIKHYISIGLTIVGIVILGIYDF